MNVDITLFYNILYFYCVLAIVNNFIGPENVYNSYVLKDEDVIGSSITDARGVVILYFCSE